MRAGPLPVEMPSLSENARTRRSIMSWARIMAAAGRRRRRSRGFWRPPRCWPKAFDAELACVHAPADVADLMPWMGEGFLGGGAGHGPGKPEGGRRRGPPRRRQAGGRARLRPQPGASACRRRSGPGLAMEGRLSDVVVFDSDAAARRGPWPRRSSRWSPTSSGRLVVARPGLKVGGTRRRGLDGGKEASRACAPRCRCWRRPPRWWWPARQGQLVAQLRRWSACVEFPGARAA